MTDWSLGNATGANPPEPGVEAALERLKDQCELHGYGAVLIVERHIAAQAQEIERLARLFDDAYRENSRLIAEVERLTAMVDSFNPSAMFEAGYEEAEKAYHAEIERLRELLLETVAVCDVEHGAPSLFARMAAALAQTKEETDG